MICAAAIVVKTLEPRTVLELASRASGGSLAERAVRIFPSDIPTCSGAMALHDNPKPS